MKYVGKMLAPVIIGLGIWGYLSGQFDTTQLLLAILIATVMAK